MIWHLTIVILSIQENLIDQIDPIIFFHCLGPTTSPLPRTCLPKVPPHFLCTPSFNSNKVHLGCHYFYLSRYLLSFQILFYLSRYYQIPLDPCISGLQLDLYLLTLHGLEAVCIIDILSNVLYCNVHKVSKKNFFGQLSTFFCISLSQQYWSSRII